MIRTDSGRTEAVEEAPHTGDVKNEKTLRNTSRSSIFRYAIPQRVENLWNVGNVVPMRSGGHSRETRGYIAVSAFLYRQAQSDKRIMNTLL